MVSYGRKTEEDVDDGPLKYNDILTVNVFGIITHWLTEYIVKPYLHLVLQFFMLHFVNGIQMRGSGWAASDTTVN